jgi:hypothetical protein
MPGWGENPLLQGAPRLATDGFGAIQATPTKLFSVWGAAAVLGVIIWQMKKQGV